MILRFRCVVCGKLTDGRLPKGGDGSVYYPRRHNGKDGEPCPGNLQEAEWIEVEKVVYPYYKRKKHERNVRKGN